MVSCRFEIGLRDLEIGIGTEVGFSNRRDVEISPFSFVKRLDEIAPPSAGPNHVRCRLQKAPKMGCDSEISPAFRPAVVNFEHAAKSSFELGSKAGCVWNSGLFQSQL